MPELPEVETTVNSLNILKNKKVIKVEIHTKKLRYPGTQSHFLFHQSLPKEYFLQ